MSESKGMTRDPLFLGLTRPAMLLGVTYNWFTFEGFVSIIMFINGGDDKFYAFLAALVFHAIGFVLCSHEPRFVDIIKVSAQTNAKCVNKRFHNNTISYDPS